MAEKDPWEQPWSRRTTRMFNSLMDRINNLEYRLNKLEKRFQSPPPNKIFLSDVDKSRARPLPADPEEYAD